MVDGAEITNTATTIADNADPASGTNLVEVEVPRDVKPVATKTWTDGAAIAGSGEASTATLGVRNGSSGPGGRRASCRSPTPPPRRTTTSTSPTSSSPASLPAPTPRACSSAASRSALRRRRLPARRQRTALGDFTVPTPRHRHRVPGRLHRRRWRSAALRRHRRQGPAGLQLRDTVRSTGDQLDPSTRQTVSNCAVPGAIDDPVAANRPATRPATPSTSSPTPSSCSSQQDLRRRHQRQLHQDAGEYAVVGENSPVSATVRVQNTSAFPVRTIVITEPDPLAPGSQSEFDKLDVTKARLRFPAGATTAQLVVKYADGTSADLRPDRDVGDRRGQGRDQGHQPAGDLHRCRRRRAPSIAQNATAFLDVHGTLNDQVDGRTCPPAPRPAWATARPSAPRPTPPTAPAPPPATPARPWPSRRSATAAPG